MDEALKLNLFLFIAKNPRSNIKQIHEFLKTNKAYTQSYKNTYKILDAQVKNKILDKKDRHYVLNKNYFKNYLYKLKEIEQFLLGKKQNIIYQDQKEVVYEANSLNGLNDLWIKIVEEETSKQEVKEVFWEGPNCWWLFASLLEEEKYLNYLKKYEIQAYFKIKSLNDLNKNAEQFYTSRGFFSRIIEGPIEKKYLHRGILGDKIIEVEYPEEINILLDKIYGSKKEQTILKGLQEIVSIEVPLGLKLIHDPEKAKELAEKIKKELN